MPRKSAAALSVVPRIDGRPTRLRPRPDVPASLKAIINDIVTSVPPEHFRPADRDLIEMYAADIALSRQAFAKLDQQGPVVNGKSNPWIVVLEKAHRSAVALSARLRLAPQMRTDPKTAGKKFQPLSYYEEERENGQS